MGEISLWPLAALYLGAEDLTADLRCRRTKEGNEIAYARGRLVCAARAAGIRVPQDLSIISFNDTVLSALTDPPLTSISTHVEEMSHLAVDLLSRRVSLGADALPLKVVVPPSLIQRESVCPPGH